MKCFLFPSTFQNEEDYVSYHNVDENNCFFPEIISI